METMTKERLEAYRNNKTEILSLKYILNNRWQSETMIGNDVILDYSKGYPIPQSIVGFDQEKYERLQERDLRRKERLEKECPPTRTSDPGTIPPPRTLSNSLIPVLFLVSSSAETSVIGTTFASFTALAATVVPFVMPLSILSSTNVFHSLHIGH